MTIIWSEKAGETFQRNIDYLKDNWTQNEVDKFVARVFQYLEILSNEPFIAPELLKRNIPT